MPPANTPSQTQPPTPPGTESTTQEPSLAPTPYLRQLEEVIAAPVPDFASTLNVPEHATPNTSLRPQYLTETEFQTSRSGSVTAPMGSRRAALREMRERLLGVWNQDPSEETNSANTSQPQTYAQLHDDFFRRYLAQDEDENDRMAGVALESTADSAARRDLERALRNYRTARNALRVARPLAEEILATPTAATHSGPRASDGVEERAAAFLESQRTEGVRRSPSSINDIVERARSARLRRQAAWESWFDGSRQRDYPYQSIPPALRDRVTSGSFVRIRNTIQYLSDLRFATVQEGFELAQRYRLDLLYNSDSHNDIPTIIDQLPFPQPSSWLVPGMVWHGFQSTDKDREPPSRSPVTGRTIAGRSLSDYSRRQQQIENLLHERPEDESLASYRTSINMRSRRLRLPLDSTSHEEDQFQTPGFGDQWPVKVTLHTVDWHKMTVTGTMAASQIPDKSNPRDVKLDGTMESYFRGEIIDFRNFTFESEEKNGYRVGGADIDAQYWQRIGPFRKAIAAQGAKPGHTQGDAVDEHNKTLFSKDDAISQAEAARASEKATYEADDIMARCIGSAKWIQNHIGQEWILMRWKEKCFLNHNDKSNATEYASRTYTSHRASFPSSSSDQMSWGLTISGFYYVALNRMTGRIDSLYYDPGSQPYQQLKMAPQNMSLGDLDGSEISSGSEKIGLKRWFPSIEVR